MTNPNPVVERAALIEPLFRNRYLNINLRSFGYGSDGVYVIATIQCLDAGYNMVKKVEIDKTYKSFPDFCEDAWERIRAEK